MQQHIKFNPAEVALLFSSGAVNLTFEKSEPSVSEIPENGEIYFPVSREVISEFRNSEHPRLQSILAKFFLAHCEHPYGTVDIDTVRTRYREGRAVQMRRIANFLEGMLNQTDRYPAGCANDYEVYAAAAKAAKAAIMLPKDANPEIPPIAFPLRLSHVREDSILGFDPAHRSLTITVTLSDTDFSMRASMDVDGQAVYLTPTTKCWWPKELPTKATWNPFIHHHVYDLK